MALVKHNNNSISNLTSAGQLAQGKMTLISSQTASGSASISFTSGIDSTYPIYRFEFINIHPSVDDVNFTFNMSTDGGSNYNVTKTTTYFATVHSENDVSASLFYSTGNDLEQSNDYQNIGGGTGTDNDQNCSGYLQIFNPSSNTFVKHFLTKMNSIQGGDVSINVFTAGYGNTSNPVNAISFKCVYGNIDSGTIKLYGIGD
jgi:hypothetical protein